MLITRRGLVATGSAATLVSIGSMAKALARTSEQVMGPFFPITHYADVDADLTRVRGRAGTAKGRPMNVVGRVLTTKGEPVRGARLELWQANAAGRYRHPGDSNPAPLDPDFQGFAVLQTDRSGHFRFRTVKPGAYPIGGGQFRTPHIHAVVSGHNERLITQMYFPGERLNATDDILKDADSRGSVMLHPIAALSGDPSALAFTWDIILAVG